MDLTAASREAIEAVSRWHARWPRFEPDASLQVDAERLRDVMHQLERRLQDNYPYFHPDYAGQMLKPPSPAAVVGYLMAMLINPNNHALDGGPATAAMEKEAVASIAAMFGLPSDYLGHLTSSGTIANLEALFVARELHPKAAVAYSEDAHYTHERMCHVLGVRGVKIATDGRGSMDLGALEQALRQHEIGTVVMTCGTTPLGAIDPIDRALALRERYGFRIHVDAAYGGFFSILARAEVEGIAAAPFDAIGTCDSVVIDPHKHGLQPYGCGCVLFRDASVGRFYKHDSPYTYFTSDELHLGEISLECSRAGAAAAALWTTLQLFPLSMDGLGRVLQGGRRAARAWHERLSHSDVLRAYQEPALDIVTYFPTSDGIDTGAIDEASQRVFEDTMTDEDPVYVSVARVAGEALRRRHPDVRVDGTGPLRILRSVLMKPEQAHCVDRLHQKLEAAARRRVPSQGRAGI